MDLFEKTRIAALFDTFFWVFCPLPSTLNTADWAGFCDRCQASQASRSMRSSFLSSRSRSTSKSRMAESRRLALNGLEVSADGGLRNPQMLRNVDLSPPRDV